VIPLELPDRAISIVCVGAHPDDIEIGCGGTLLRLAATHDLAAAVVIATGAGERREEAKAAAAAFVGPRADVRILGLRDGRLPAQWEAVKDSLEDVADSIAPDIVFAPRLDDAHQDHSVVAEIAATVWRDALIARYEIPKWDGDLGRVSHYVPLSHDVAQQKIALLDKCFPSQTGRDWWDSETFLGLLRLRGIECRGRYAEGFVVDKTILLG
jgi:LmbE family N-acetylglucosaminyl deacetylase